MNDHDDNCDPHPILHKRINVWFLIGDAAEKDRGNCDSYEWEFSVEGTEDELEMTFRSMVDDISCNAQTANFISLSLGQHYSYVRLKEGEVVHELDIAMQDEENERATSY